MTARSHSPFFLNCFFLVFFVESSTLCLRAPADLGPNRSQRFTAQSRARPALICWCCCVLDLTLSLSLALVPLLLSCKKKGFSLPYSRDWLGKGRQGEGPRRRRVTPTTITSRGNPGSRRCQVRERGGSIYLSMYICLVRPDVRRKSISSRRALTGSGASRTMGSNLMTPRPQYVMTPIKCMHRARFRALGLIDLHTVET